MATQACAHIPGIHQVDLIILTGDQANFDSRPEVKQVLDQVMTYNPNVLAQIGNIDYFEINDYLEQLNINPISVSLAISTRQKVKTR